VENDSAFNVARACYLFGKVILLYEGDSTIGSERSVFYM